MQQFDVVIVGAGPAGSSAAIALARIGYSVALLDKKEFPREKLCGDFLNPVNWPLLRELGVDEDILACSHEKVARFRLTSCSGEAAEVPLARRNGEMFGLGLRRSDLDHVLLNKAKSEGATVFENCRVSQLERKSQRWLIRWGYAGLVEEVRATMLIGADGRNSWVAHRLKMANRDSMSGRSVGFQLRLKCAGGSRGNVEIHLFPGGYAGVVGVGSSTVNLCLAIDKDRLTNHRPAEFVLDSCLPQSPSLKEILCGERVGEIRSTYPIYFAPRRAYDEAVLLAGDAARVNEPVTGEGIYFALRSGFLAAESVHQAFRAGDFSTRLLSRYARHCREAFRFRRRMNALIRFLIYRPAILSPLIRLSAKKRQLLDSLVHPICLP